MKKLSMKDIVQKVNKSQNNETFFDLECLCEALNLTYNYDVNYESFTRFKGYYLFSWMCTDTHVGCSVYFLDDEVICFGSKKGRKVPEEFFFVSQESAEKLRDYLSEMMKKSVNVNIVDLDGSCEPFFNVEFTGELLQTEGFHEGRKCFVDKEQNKNIINQLVNITYEDGTKNTISIKEFKMPFYLK